MAISDIAAAPRNHAAAIFACSPPCVQFAQGLNGERTTATRRRRASSSLVFALDALAGVVLHERGSDETDHRAHRNVAGDRMGGVIAAEQASGDQRRRAA